MKLEHFLPNSEVQLKHYIDSGEEIFSEKNAWKFPGYYFVFYKLH